MAITSSIMESTLDRTELEITLKRRSDKYCKLCSWVSNVTPSQTATPKATATPVPTPKVNDVVTDMSGKGKYKILSESTVAFTAPVAKNPTTFTIPATVKISGKTYKVTEVSAKAFKNKKKLKKVTSR